MQKIRYWMGPVVTLIAWITVVAYTVSMLATVEPSFRSMLKASAQANPRV